MFQAKRKTPLDSNNEHLLEKRVKKTETSIEQLNKDVAKLNDAVIMLSTPGGGGVIPGLPDLGLPPGLDLPPM